MLDPIVPFIFYPEASRANKLFVSFAFSCVSENVSEFYTEKMARF